jgi:anti-sigma regulatory factor (Ser/Thr protein kinase)
MDRRRATFMAERSPSPQPDRISYVRADDLAAVRAFVAARATAEGLPPQRVALLTLAISELATNTLQHTDGGGQVQVLVQDGQLVYNVTDTAPTDSLPQRRGMPTPAAIRGRGLAIVEHICDVVDVAPAAEGTRVQIRLNL